MPDGKGSANCQYRLLTGHRSQPPKGSFGSEEITIKRSPDRSSSSTGTGKNNNCISPNCRHFPCRWIISRPHTPMVACMSPGVRASRKPTQYLRTSLKPPLRTHSFHNSQHRLLKRNGSGFRISPDLPEYSLSSRHSNPRMAYDFIWQAVSSRHPPIRKPLFAQICFLIIRRQNSGEMKDSCLL